jgi:hypothetical protein
MTDLKTKLRVEVSLNSSGIIHNLKDISVLKEKHYYVEDIDLDGDAPKQFIRIYQYREDSGIFRNDLRSWEPYIAKTAEKWYPHESVIEFMINRIGQVLGLRLNEVSLLKINGQIRFLSKFFLKKNDVLIHGAEICGSYLSDQLFAEQIAKSPKESRELFTFEFICKAIISIFGENGQDIITDLVALVTFDAITGNNDRHFYNWGVITTKKRSASLPKLAPIYDSARGLFWNESDEQLIKILENYRSGGKRIEKYLNNSLPRISVEGNSGINHFELIQFLKGHKPAYRQLIETIASEKNEQIVISMLKKDFFRYFSDERKELILLVLANRFKKVRE